MVRRASTVPVVIVAALNATLIGGRPAIVCATVTARAATMVRLGEGSRTNPNTTAASDQVNE